MPEPKQHPERKSHRLSPVTYTRAEHAYFFTICARHRGVPFNNSKLASAVVNSLLWTRERYSWSLYAYCLMPDHLHFLCRPLEPIQGTVNAGIRGTQPLSVLDHISRFKSFTTQNAWQFEINGELWQRSSYDVLTDGTRSTEEMARYILENPVRKGLVTSWTDWPHSGIPDPW